MDQNYVDQLIDKANEKLRERYGKNITLKIYGYTEDDGSIWFEYRGVTTNGSAFSNIDVCYNAACEYMNRDRWANN